MAEFTLKVRRFKPDEAAQEAKGPYWESFDVDLDPTLSVLDGLLQAKDREDGSLAVRCSCRAAICGSCGMKINGQSGLACKTMIGEASEFANRKNGGHHHKPGFPASPSGAAANAVEAVGDKPGDQELGSHQEVNQRYQQHPGTH